MSTITSVLHRRCAALTMSGAVLFALTGMPAAAGEQSPEEQPPEERSCPVVAAAHGVHLTVSASDNILLEKPAGMSLPAAQSCVDYGVRDSWSLAGAPYPGENVAALPASLRNSGVPVPDYPAYAASRYPSSEKSEKSDNGYTLSARSGETSSESQASSGAEEDTASVASSTVSAASAVDPAAGTSRARAESDIQPLSFADVLELGRVRSEATASMGADGKVRRDSRLAIGRTSVAGQEVEITPDGVEAAGQTVGVPQADPEDALEAAGVRIHYLAATKTERGVLSAGVEILVRHHDTERDVVYEAHHTLGRTFAAVAKVAGASGSDLSGGAVPAAGSAPGGPAEAPVSGDVDSGSAPEQGAPTPADPPEVAGAPEVAPPPEVRAAPAALSGAPADMGIAGLYLVIVFCALAMVAGGTLLRVLGVKTRWTS